MGVRRNGQWQAKGAKNGRAEAVCTEWGWEMRSGGQRKSFWGALGARGLPRNASGGLGAWAKERQAWARPRVRVKGTRARTAQDGQDGQHSTGPRNWQGETRAVWRAAGEDYVEKGWESTMH